MKKTLLTACVAALSIAGCKDKPTPTPAPVSITTERVVMMPALAVNEPTAATPPIAREQPDAGSDEVALADDGVALDHPHSQGVDHLARARQLKEEGDLDGALTEARRAVFDDAEDEDALAMIDHFAEVKGNLGLAAAALHRLGNIEPEDPSPRVREARLQIARGEYSLAIQAGNEAIARDEDDADAYHVTGRAHLAGGDLQGAIDLFQKAIAIEPEHGYALNNLGLAYLRASRNDEAVEVLAKAAAILPNVAYVQNNYGVALERTGKREEAGRAYELASMLSPKYLKAQLNAERIKNVASATEQEPELLTPPAPPAESNE